MNQVIEQVLQNTSWLTFVIPAVLSVVFGVLIVGMAVEIIDQRRMKF